MSVQRTSDHSMGPKMATTMEAYSTMVLGMVLWTAHSREQLMEYLTESSLGLRLDQRMVQMSAQRTSDHSMGPKMAPMTATHSRMVTSMAGQMDRSTGQLTENPMESSLGLRLDQRMVRMSDQQK